MFKVNDVGGGDKKALLHAKRWDVSMNENENLIKGGLFGESCLS